MKNIELFFVIDGTPDLLTPVRTISIDWYVRGTERTGVLRLYYLRDCSSGPLLYNFALGLGQFGEDPILGKEMLDEGFFYMRLLGAPSWVSMTSTARLVIGDMEPGDYADIEIKLMIPNETDRPDLETAGYCYLDMYDVYGNLDEQAQCAADYGIVMFGKTGLAQVPDRIMYQYLDSLNWIIIRAFVMLESNCIEYESAGIEFEGREY